MTNIFKPLLFVVFVLAQLAALGWIIFERYQLMEHGAVVRLQCGPVDPRSLLSGDYVNLEYQISRFNDAQLKQLVRGESKFHPGRPVWVALRKNERTGFYEASGISTERDRLRDDKIVLRGHVESFGYHLLRVRYGIETYFVPQGEGKKIEQQMRSTSVDVAVNEAGDSAVIRIFINGEEVKFH